MLLLKRLLLPKVFGGGKRAIQALQLKSVPEDLGRLIGWMEEGKVKAVIDEVFEW